jgi:hypothetical protein
VDWALAGEAIDQAVSIHNWYPAEDSVSSYREALAKTAPSGVEVEINAAQTLCGYGFWEQRGAWRWLREIKTNLLRRTVHLGADVYNLCGIWGMDSQWNTGVRQVNAILAKYRDFVRSAKKVQTHSVTGFLPDGAYIDTFSDGKRSVSFIFNPTDSTSEIKLTIPGKPAKAVSVTAYDVIPVEY